MSSLPSRSVARAVLSVARSSAAFRSTATFGLAVCSCHRHGTPAGASHHKLFCPPLPSFSPRVRLFSTHPHAQSSTASSDPAAELFSLGNAHYEGSGGVAKSYKQALVHYTEAAVKGHAGAATRLGVMYLAGYGVARSLPTAVTFFTQAAAQQQPEAQAHLASMHQQGLGVPRDPTRAASLYQAAADGGSSRAALLYAKALAKGEGVPVDYASALRYSDAALASGDKEAQYIVAMLLSHRHPYAPSPTPPAGTHSSSPLFSFIPYSPERALSLLHSSSSANFVPALTSLADHYATLQPEPDHTLAVSLYSQAADLTSIYAHARRGFLLYHGVGVEPARATAMVSLATAGEAGRAEALLMMMAVAWERAGRDLEGRVGKMNLRVKEVLDEYAGKAVDSVERGKKDEWTEDERRMVRRLKEEPQLVAGWLDLYEREKGGPWLGDMHDLLAVVQPSEDKNQATPS